MEGKILVVHRNELILDVIQEMLQDVGYAVSLTSDPQRALSKAMAHSYEVIIIDRHLEGEFDGVRLVELLRKYGVQSPVIGTAPNADWAEQSIDLVDLLLPAPFDYSELIKAVADLLEDEPHPIIDNHTDLLTQQEDHLKLDLSDLLPSPLRHLTFPLSRHQPTRQKSRFQCPSRQPDRFDSGTRHTSKSMKARRESYLLRIQTKHERSMQAG
jgi:DNA-binding response OmpR family regulator